MKSILRTLPLLLLGFFLISSSVSAATSFTRKLKLGDTGVDVKAVQTVLNNKGYFINLTGANSPGEETGVFDKATEKQVIIFQQANRKVLLTPYGLTKGTGVIGESTFSLLGIKASIPSTVLPTPKVTATPVVTTPSDQVISRTLKPGDRNEQVRTLQIFLNGMGFFIAPSGPGSVSNETYFYGAGTAKQVKLFQETYRSDILTPSGLTKGTGIVGPSTRTLIASLMVGKKSPVTTHVATVPTTTSTTTATVVTSSPSISSPAIVYSGGGGGSAPSTPAPATDTTPPSVPSSLSLSSVSTSTITLSYAASTDNVAVSYYRIYRNNTLLATTSALTYTSTGLTSSTTYSFNVSALDTSGNTSATSTTVSTSTLSGPLTLIVSPSRITGVAPLAVFFDAASTTSSSVTSRPFHDIEYSWGFGDPSSGTWTTGARPGASRNTAKGPEAAHVFETPGTYTVTTSAFDGTNTSSVTNTITVTDPDTQWAGTKTICISTSGTFTGCPSGAVQVTSSDADASIASNIGTGNVRLLFRRGETFAVSTSIAVTKSGPSMIGAYGTGAKPLFDAAISSATFNLSSSITPTGVSDWRFQDIAIDGNNLNNSTGFSGAGSFSNVLFDRVYVTRIGYGVVLSGSVLNALNASVPYTHAIWDGLYMHDSTIYDLYTSASGPNAFFGNAKHAAMIGNNIDNNTHGEHGIRFQYANRVVIEHNTIQGIAPGKTNLTIRGTDYAGNTTEHPGAISEKIVISDNKMIGGASVGMVGFGPENGTIDERGQDIIFERNFLLCSSTTQNTILVSQPDVTLRNNVLNFPGPSAGGFAFGIQLSGIVPNPDRVHIYNNTVYHAGSSTNNWTLLWVSSNNDTSPYDQTMPGSVFQLKNNLLYAPYRQSGYLSMFGNYNGSVATTTQSNNTVDPITDPHFAVTPPVVLSDYTPSLASYARNAGAVVPVYSDFFGTAQSTTFSMGAIIP
jgi:peptidoglycan hydrolase-like protein with peptidoglycan-binding domain